MSRYTRYYDMKFIYYWYIKIYHSSKDMPVSSKYFKFLILFPTVENSL